MLKSKITRLVLRSETIRSLASGQLTAVHGGAINQTVSLCATECPHTGNGCLSTQCVMTDMCGDTYVGC
jgi:hypothetical protein